MYQLWHHIIGWPSKAAESNADDDSDDGPGYFEQPSEQTTDRIGFGTRGALIYGYPSTGGVLVKEADPVDVQYLSLSCLGSYDRAKDAVTEDRFCRRMLQVDATFWHSKRSRHLSQLSDDYMTKEQSKIMVYGWPPGQGIWLLRYDDEQQLPDDFGRIHLVTSMQAKIEVMKSFMLLSSTMYRRSRNSILRNCRGCKLQPLWLSRSERTIIHCKMTNWIVISRVRRNVCTNGPDTATSTTPA